MGQVIRICPYRELIHLEEIESVGRSGVFMCYLVDTARKFVVP
jgi:hypothetical protein